MMLCGREISSCGMQFSICEIWIPTSRNAMHKRYARLASYAGQMHDEDTGAAAGLERSQRVDARPVFPASHVRGFRA